jgi:tetratricopeptide (TPR) repeat protein
LFVCLCFRRRDASRRRFYFPRARFFLFSTDELLSTVSMFNLTRRFPLQVSLAAFVLYAAAVSHGVTLNSLSLTAKLAGWDETPLVGQPLLWLLTLPLRLLPAGSIALALNLFSAATAALTLGLLARSVQLLPWDQPWTNENRRAAALPVLLAAGLCGLEFNFWQDAAAATGELLDLLLLATPLWLLLEYRVRREARWLDAAAVVWGLGMAENWLMQLALPLFIGGVIWLQGRRFFRLKFGLRLAGLGLAGFSIYALLPLVNGLNPHSPWSLGESWLVSLKQTKNMVRLLYYQFWMAHRLLTVVVVIYFLVPTLPCLVRLRDEGTNNKSGVDRFQVWLYRGLRAGLLLACLWLAFDPVTGPRQLVQHQLGATLPLLAFDYLNALGAAFLLGNLLLIFQGAVEERRRRSQSKIPWRKLAAPGAAGVLALMVAALAARNAPAILRANFHPLQRFGELAVESLPAGRGVVLSDQPQKLEVFQAALSHHRNASDWLAVDTRALPTVTYRAQLERRRPAGWLTESNRHELTQLETLQLLAHLAPTNRLFYLHFSYGLFFERFYLEPAGAVYEVKLRGTNFLDLPPLPAAVTAANEAFWTAAWQKDFSPLATAASSKPAGWEKKIQRLGFAPAPRQQDRLLAEWYSLALDNWGVTLQRQGRWPEARLRLEQALQLNPNNFSAQISLTANTNLQAGLKLGLAEVGKVAEQLGNLQRLSLLMNNGGQFDEPVFCYLLGCAFQKTGLRLQAVEQFERTRSLAPDVLAPKFALAELYSQLQLTDRARPFINQLRDETQKLPDSAPVDLELALLEANTWLAQTNVANARSALQSVLQQHPDDVQIANRVISAYLAFGDFTNALQLVDGQLAKSPDDVQILNNQAAILIQAGQPAAAIPVLDHALALTNLPAFRLNRAIARLASEDFTAAEADYRELEKSGEEPGRVSFGLAAIAYHRHDTNLTIQYLQLCLTNTPAGTMLWHQASARLQSLQPGSGTK